MPFGGILYSAVIKILFGGCLAVYQFNLSNRIALLGYNHIIIIVTYYLLCHSKTEFIWCSKISVVYL